MNSIKSGDILQNKEGQRVSVIKYKKTGLQVWSKGAKITIPFEDLEINWKIANPIIGNRIVNDYTFAVRFKQFLDWIPKNWWMSQPHYYDEYKYMQIVAERLLKYQIETMTNESEIKYFKNLNDN